MIAAIILALAAIGAGDAATAPPGRLIVRYDDYAPVVHYSRTSRDGETERRLFALFAEHEATLVVGVIPFPIEGASSARVDPQVAHADQSWLANRADPWVVLLRDYVRRKTVEPALHGFEHRRRSAPGHRPGEFRGQSLEWQTAAIRVGVQAMESAVGEELATFIPPWNAWDENTRRACAIGGLSWLSPDLHHAEMNDTHGIGLVPQTVTHPRAALDWVRTHPSPEEGTIVVLVTHPFDFEGPQGESYFQSLRELLLHVRDAAAWDCPGFWSLPREAQPELNARFRAATAYEATRQFLGDALGGAFLGQPPQTMLAPSATLHSQSRAWQWSMPLLLAAAALPALALGALSGRVTRSMPKCSLILVAISITLLFALVGGAQSIVRSGYHVRAVRWQAILFLAAYSIGAAWVARTALLAGLSELMRRFDGVATKRSHGASQGVPR